MSNKAGECESSAELNVIKPNIVKLLKGLEDITVDQDQSIQLLCKIEGNPNSFKWYKNGKEIELNDRIKTVNFYKIFLSIFFLSYQIWNLVIIH